MGKQFTKESWRFERKGCVIYSGDGKKRVAKIAEVSVGYIDEVELVARGQLIASCPDLVEALRGMLDEKIDYMRINNLGDPEQQHTVKAARAALSRATGEG